MGLRSRNAIRGYNRQAAAMVGAILRRMGQGDMMFNTGDKVRLKSGTFKGITGVVTEASYPSTVAVKLDKNQVSYSKYGDVWACGVENLERVEI